MIEAIPHSHEHERLEALKQTRLLDGPIEERFERLTRMVCRTLGVPIALFNLIDEDRQHYKSVQGLPTTDAPLDAAFCTHAIHEQEMLLVPDASKDDRFWDNPFVNGERLNVGFYAGCPVRTPNGMPIGTLCAIDTKPRDLTIEQISTLRDLAMMLETELRVASLSKSESNLIDELQAAKHLALVDPLTRLWNRSGIMKLLDKEWSEAARQEKPITLVMSDIDHFKKVNDTYGHPIGDEVLKKAAKKLLECLRSEDAIGRVGGEEFLILLTDCDPDNVFMTVDRIRKTIVAQPFHIEGNDYPVTMSFGAATLTPSSNTVDSTTLIKLADDALYRAKNSGRNKVEAVKA